MIIACSWCSPAHCGVRTPDGVGNDFRPGPPLADEPLTRFIGRPIKYLARMTPECRAGLYAAGLIMKTCGWLDAAPLQIGIFGAGFTGCLLADQKYFQDYVASGRSLGRGSLFIYTLPSSTLAEVAIALALTGPGMHIDGDNDTLGTLVRHADQLVTDGEADAMLALWSDATSAICLAIDASPDRPFDLPTAADPTEMTGRLASFAGSK